VFVKKDSRLNEKTRELRDGEEEVVRGKRHRKRENKAKNLTRMVCFVAIKLSDDAVFLSQTRTENRVL